jgi:hypothetical protein
MKKMALFLLFIILFMLLYMQTSITITVKTGQLHTQINPIQRILIQKITLKGCLNADDFFFMREFMHLTEMDLTHTDVDTIPSEAIKGLEILYLPQHVIYVADNAIRMCENNQNFIDQSNIIITGHFPKRGNMAFFNANKQQPCYGIPKFTLSHNNKAYKLTYVGNRCTITSNDGKVLYLNTSTFYIPKGVEIVAERALEGVTIYENATLPSSVKWIKTNALSHINVALKNNNVFSLRIKCDSPPELGEKVFSNDNFKKGIKGYICWDDFDLLVDSPEKYNKLHPWTNFKAIK